MTIKKIHYISGLTIILFIGLHLFNHLFSLFGAEKHIELMNSLRVIYRNIFVEAILLLAVLTQIISGLSPGLLLTAAIFYGLTNHFEGVSFLPFFPTPNKIL